MERGPLPIAARSPMQSYAKIFRGKCARARRGGGGNIYFPPWGNPRMARHHEQEREIRREGGIV